MGVGQGARRGAAMRVAFAAGRARAGRKAAVVLDDVQARERQRVKRGAQLGVSGRERLRSRRRGGGDTRDEAGGGLGEADADLAELGGVQRDARLRETAARGQLDCRVHRVDRLVEGHGRRKARVRGRRRGGGARQWGGGRR